MIIHFLSFVILSIFGGSYADRRVKLRDVEVLTFHLDQYTTGRRSAPLPQISCVKGCNYFVPDEVQCYNSK
jgi:hypothetical protein